MTAELDMSIYREKPFAMDSRGNSVTIYPITMGAMAAVPMPTIKRASSINKREGARADRAFPNAKTAMPDSRVTRRPMTSPSLPRTGAQAAVDMARASAVHVVLL